MGSKKEYIILIGILVGSLIIGYGIKNVFAISYEEWGNYRILTFEGGFEGLQVNFNVTYGFGDNGLNGNCKENFEDLRFFDYYTDELLSAWNKTTVNEDYCEIWLKLVSSNVTMRYNNPSAESYWDINAVFEDVIGDVVLALPMDEGSGSTVYDYSGNDLNGVIVGGSWVEGYFIGQTALEFNGTDTNEYVYVSNNVFTNLATTDFSMFLRIYSKNGGLWGLCSNGLGAHSGQIGYVWQGTINDFKMNNGSTPCFTATGDSFTLNDWVTGSVVVDRDLNVTVYQGVSSVSTSLSGFNNISQVGYDFYIGRYGSLEDFAFVVCEFFITDDLLTLDEITILQTYFSDFAIVEGSVCCRVWVDVMPIPLFSSEYSNLTNDAILIGVLALVVALCSLLLVIIMMKKK